LLPTREIMPQHQAVAARRFSISRFRAVAIHTIVVLACAPSLYAQTVNLTLGWDRNAEPDVAGYVVSIGTQSGQYTTNIDVGNATTRTVSLAVGSRYYFAVRAYNTSRQFSPYSNEIQQVLNAPRATPTVFGDSDGDGRADPFVFRPSTGQWSVLSSTTNYTTGGTRTLGVPGDVPIPGDYDGDGKMDLAVYRPSTGGWYILWSAVNYSDGEVHQWGGQPGDIPIAADFDGDGRTDLTIFRPSSGVWYTSLSTLGYTGSVTRQSVGRAGDVPLAGDFDGDGKSDIIIYRPSSGMWYGLSSSSNYSESWARQWGGQSGDTPITADFDGDGRADVTIYRPSSGMWSVLSSTSNYTSGPSIQWGQSGDVPVAADYKGDGSADFAVYRPSTDTWLISGLGAYKWASTGPSPDRTRIPSAPLIVDTDLAVWTLGPGEQILKDGRQVAGGFASQILWYQGVIYVLGDDNNWWQWTGNAWTFTGSADPSAGPSAGPSPDRTRIPSAPVIIDTNLAVWTLGPGEEILKDGRQAAGAFGSQILWYQGVIYVLGDDNNWWRWTGNTWTFAGSRDPSG
jgi:FG-GAP-like repeat